MKRKGKKVVTFLGSERLMTELQFPQDQCQALRPETVLEIIHHLQEIATMTLEQWKEKQPAQMS